MPDHSSTHVGLTISKSISDSPAFPPVSLLEGATLFLDLDGTLVDLIERPDEVTADASLRDLLSRLHQRLAGRLAVISGRSIAQLDVIFGPLAETLVLSGSHGCEHRCHGIHESPDRPAALGEAAHRFRCFAENHDGLLVEEKTFGVALHYRLCPHHGKAAVEFARQVASETDLILQHGKQMIEIRMPGADKGVAVRHLMQRIELRGTRPLFIGDDLTDEPAFEAAVALGGTGIFVGEPRETAASYFLPDPDATRAWLARSLA